MTLDVNDLVGELEGPLTRLQLLATLWQLVAQQEYARDALRGRPGQTRLATLPRPTCRAAAWEQARDEKRRTVWNAQRRARDQELRALLIKSQAAPEPERSMLITRVIALLT